jgi:hypothetical protein
MARYNIRNIRTMLTEGFNAEELRELAYDEPDFRPVYDQLSSSAGKAEIIQRLIEYAERRVKMDALLAWARERNPARYGQDQLYSDSPTSSIPSKPVSPTTPPDTLPPARPQWDVFISHASEDKAFVRQLAEALAKKGLRVWLDELTMTVGDSLREEIDRGLANSKYGVVVLSPNFFKKHWAKSELDALEARQNVAGKKVILPVWHNISRDEVMQYSPLLAGRLAVSSAQGLDHVVAELVRAIQ